MFKTKISIKPNYWQKNNLIKLANCSQKDHFVLLVYLFNKKNREREKSNKDSLKDKVFLLNFRLY